MADIWTIGPTAAAFMLRARGFSPRTAERVVGVMERDARGDFTDLTAAEKRRLVFVCWLVDHRRIGDGQVGGWLPTGAAVAPLATAAPAASADHPYERSAA